MNLQTIFLYLTVVVFIVSGLVPCWRSKLSFIQKLFWSGIIIVLPGAGTLFYLGMRETIQDSKSQL